MIDRTVKTLLEANAQQCGHQAKSHCIVVRWDDAPIGHFLANYDGGLSFEYTIDIEPGPASELGLKSVLYKNEEKVCNGNTIVGGTHLSTHGTGSGYYNFVANDFYLFICTTSAFDLSKFQNETQH